MINLHLAHDKRPIWINESLITALVPTVKDTTFVFMANDSNYEVEGKPSTIAMLINEIQK